MPRPRTYGSNKGVVNDGPDWTYSQYVIVIVVVVFLCLTCFSIGYIMAPIDRPLGADGEMASNTNGPTSLPPLPEAGVKPQEPENTDPPKASAPVITPPRNTEGVVKRPSLNPTEIQPLASPTAGPIPMVKTPVSLPGAPAGERAPSSLPTTAPATTPTAPTPPTVPEAPIVTPSEPPASAANSTPPPKPVVTPPKPEAPSAAKGSWGIQVAFFDGKDRKQQAETIKQRLKSSANQESKIVISNNGKEHRVVIDGFSTPEAARLSCEKLKTKTGFGDAWVKRLP